MSQEQNAFHANKPAIQSTGAGIPVSSPGKSGQSGTAGSLPPGAVSDELVRKVADKVFNMLLAELHLDFERQRVGRPEMSSQLSSRWQGGWK